MRLIDADKIVYSWQIDADGEEHDGVTLQSIIKKMPTIDPTPHGWWMTLERGEHGYSSGDFKCSVCGGPNRCYSLTKYCANCGARMKEGTD